MLMRLLKVVTFVPVLFLSTMCLGIVGILGIPEYVILNTKGIWKKADGYHTELIEWYLS